MKVIEHLSKAKEPLISFEIIPPKRGGDIKSLLALVDDLAQYKPPFIDITSHAAEVIYEETPKGIKRKTKRKRPGTLGICALIQKKYNIDAVPHILCQGFTREETEDFLIDLQYLEIENVLAVRGDDTVKPVPDGRTTNSYAVDLVRQVNDMNSGKYLEENLLDARPAQFCVGVGGYPEKHFEAPNLDTDILFLKEKIDAGASYIVTQMFYDNNNFFEFQKKCRAAGITAPIIPGLKILTRKTNLNSIPRNFYIDLPADLTKEVMKCKGNDVHEVGAEWAAQQVKELIESGVPSIHFYVMQNSKAINSLMKKLSF
ncbi:MAG: methylenetetrahydrofolate reductase [NAD(P)H] [Calditrichaeota bacterium]|nr:MAG: methylenetetrahydrofolate reductase [NAD(P)H] [Calditrichota bacterium]MBL1204092.1 methylenetetrahydrofolate reductase [NAD(P)H] [Calditrichota bacterium]NOG43923.1 methylenetetrahydrofolate reductase [NAD(P)H] [Calditrichota bacterium]